MTIIISKIIGSFIVIKPTGMEITEPINKFSVQPDSNYIFRWIHHFLFELSIVSGFCASNEITCHLCWFNLTIIPFENHSLPFNSFVCRWANDISTAIRAWMPLFQNHASFAVYLFAIDGWRLLFHRRQSTAISVIWSANIWVVGHSTKSSSSFNLLITILFIFKDFLRKT